MKHTNPQRYRYSLLIAFLFSYYLSYAAVISFEDNVPNGWSVTNGTLNISQEKAKLGSSSLCWEWRAGSVLTANESSIQTSSAQTNGGITLWVYNTTPSEKSLLISFHNTSGRKCSLTFKLNFTGWRCLWARYIEDMGLSSANKGTLTSMKINAPANGSGKVFLDYLEFSTNVSWEKMSNLQYVVNESPGIESYLNVRNIENLPPTPPTEIQRSAFQTINKRIEDWYYGTGKYTNESNYSRRSASMDSYINRGTRNAPEIAANGTINNSGLFPHDHYHGKTIDGVKVVSSRNIGESYLIQLAYDYKRNKNQASLNKALELLDWYYDQGWADGSTLGTLRMEMLRSAGYYHSAFMLQNELGEDRLKRISETSRWLTLFGLTYTEPENPGELADYIRALAIPKLFYALMLQDESKRNTALSSFQQYMNNALRHAQGFLGSLKPDGSGYHHHAPYYSAYYPQVLYVGCFLYYLLHDTPFALNDEAYQNLKQGLLAFRFLSAEYNVPGGTGGRFPHQTEILQQLIPAFAYLTVSRQDAELTSAFKRLWKPEHSSVKDYVSNAGTSICFTSTYGEIETILDAAMCEGEAEINPVGSKYMPYSGLLVVRQPEWVFTVKGFSKYIWDYESSGTENLYGRYLSYGLIEYSDLANGYRSYELNKDDTDGKTEWDWNLLPGTTTKYLSPESLSYLATDGAHRNFSDQTFLGGIGFDSSCSMFTNRIHDNAIDNSFYSDKSIFIFDNAIYCMGSGINDKSTTTPFYTTLFQNKKDRGSQVVTVNGEIVTENKTDLENPVIRDNFGNAYIVHGGYTNIKSGTDYISAYINHGRRVVNKAYNYTWLIKPTETQTEQYKNNSPIAVLKQDNAAHAVYHTEKKVLSASIFDPQADIDINEIHKVNIPILFMMKETGGLYEVAFSNPDMDRPSAANNNGITDAIAAAYGAKSEIRIELNGNFVKTPGDNSKIEVYQSNGITTLSYSGAQDGETYRVKLTKTGTGICRESIQGINVNTWISNGRCNISLSEPKEYRWTLLDMNGKVFRTGEENNENTVIDIQSIPVGVYFIKIRIDNEEQISKLIK